LFGVKVDSEENVFLNIVSEVVQKKGIELIGITPEAIAKVVKGAMK